MTDSVNDDPQLRKSARQASGLGDAGLRRSFVRLPSALRLALAFTGLYALAIVGIVLWYDAPLVVPNARVVRVLGVNSSMPILVGLAAYLLSQGIRWLSGSAPLRPAELLRNSLHDLSFVALFVIVVYLHFNLKMWIPVINPELHDARYFAWENELRWLVEACLAIRGSIAPYLPLVDHWYQLVFVMMFVTSFSYFAVGRERYYPNFALAILTVMIVGGFAYLIAPAVGPFLYEQGANAIASEAQASMWWAYREVLSAGMPWIAEHGQEYFISSLAAMPSLHVANVVVMTYYLLRSRSILGPIFVLLSCWILIESVASRWHYTVDAPFGILLAVAVIWSCDRICAPREAAESPAGEALPVVR